MTNNLDKSGPASLQDVQPSPVKSTQTFKVDFVFSRLNALAGLDTSICIQLFIGIGFTNIIFSISKVK